MTEINNPMPDAMPAADPGLPEYFRCNLCGADNPEVFFPAPPDARFPGRGLGIVRCRCCGLVYRNIRENADVIRAYYDRQAGGAINPGWVAGRERAFAGQLKLLESARKTNRILDVGAGHGFFLGECAARGWECRGVEPSRPAAEYARKRFGLELDCARFEDAAYPENHFDAVTFINALEFLPDPKAALLKTLRLLRPGGMVLARFSNGGFHVAARKLMQCLGRIHPRFDYSGLTVIHLYAFDRKTITRLLHEAGFADAKIMLTPLGWTTISSERSGPLRDLACGLFYACARVLGCISMMNLLVSPSLMIMAKKRWQNPAAAYGAG